jgi:hypothetical protein
MNAMQVIALDDEALFALLSGCAPSSSRSFPSCCNRCGIYGVAERHLQQSDASIEDHNYSAASGHVPRRSIAGHDHQRAVSRGDLRRGNRDGRDHAGVGVLHTAKRLNVQDRLHDGHLRGEGCG